MKISLKSTKVTEITEEQEKLFQECLRLLKKISNHRYSIKLLHSAVHALKTISDYKPPLSDIRRSKPNQSSQFELMIPKKNE